VLSTARPGAYETAFEPLPIAKTYFAFARDCGSVPLDERRD
jgi:hypothetical protein